MRSDSGVPTGASGRYPKWPLYLIIIIATLLGWQMVWGMISPTPKTVVEDGLKIEFIPSGRNGLTEETPLKVNAEVTARNQIPTGGVKVIYYSSVETLPNIQVTEMSPAAGTGFYTATLPSLKMGQEYYYYLQATDSLGNTIIFPDGAPGTWKKNKLLSAYYKRGMMPWLSDLHLLTMVLALVFLLHAGYYALMHLASGGTFAIGKTVSATLWGFIFFFITSFPVGCLLAYAAYGHPWTGVPLVWKLDDADNRSLIVFIFFLIALWLVKGSLFRKDKSNNLISTKGFAWLALIGVFIIYYFTFTGGHN